MNNLFFEFGKFQVLPSSYPELKRIAKIIRKYKLKVEIDGHTDDVGDAESNLVLSNKRAEAVKEFLVRIGCKDELLITHGFGEAKPRSTNDSEAGRANNRRVELKLIK
jgi:outer membrane protein OmpA-like peptidoglycan-associated protein